MSENPYTPPRAPEPADQPEPTGQPAVATRGSLVVIFLAVFIDLLGFGLVIPLLPIYAKQYTLDDTGITIGLLMASFSAMQFFFAPLWGRLSDRIGRRPVLMAGLAGSVIFYSLFGLATIYRSLAGLFIARIGAGIAGATISTAQAYIADTTTLQNRVKGMALIGASFGLGFTFGPLLGALAVPDTQGDPGPGPGFVAAALSAVALALAWFKLPESLKPGSESAGRRVFDFAALSEAVRIPSMPMLMLGLFVCVFSFANFETTLSLLLIKDKTGTFHMTFREVCYTYAFIGVMLTLAQGVLVRRLSKRVPEGALAAIGAMVEVVGFVLLSLATTRGSWSLLFGALSVVVCGFAMITPSLNSLISRRTDPARQGGILGLSQSISALARIVGPVVGIPLMYFDPRMPAWVASGLMFVGLGLVLAAWKGGQDFVVEG